MYQEGEWMCLAWTCFSFTGTNFWLTIFYTLAIVLVSGHLMCNYDQISSAIQFYLAHCISLHLCLK